MEDKTRRTLVKTNTLITSTNMTEKTGTYILVQLLKVTMKILITLLPGTSGI